MALGRMERILILAETYPSPSAQYVETSYVAGISQDGNNHERGREAARLFC